MGCNNPQAEASVLIGVPILVIAGLAAFFFIPLTVIYAPTYYWWPEAWNWLNSFPDWAQMTYVAMFWILVTIFVLLPIRRWWRKPCKGE